jgi:uncharacterized protein YjiS (DUF1127 family)
MAGFLKIPLLVPLEIPHILGIQGRGHDMNIRQKLNQFANYRRTVRELRTLDAHQLADIGLSRGDIAAVARAQIQ